MHIKRNIVLVFVFTMSLFTAVVGGTAVLAGRQNAPTDSPLNLSLSLVSSGFNSPISIANAGDDRLFIVEQAGIIKILHPDLSVTSFLTITDRVDDSDNEEGLLGLTFHPDYATNGYFYVNYTYTPASTRYTRISRFSVTGDPDVADPNSEDVLLTVVQPSWNHNAGDIHFSPNDGYLYIPLGDGGGSGDTSNNAQNLSLALGKILRIDVDTTGGSPAECTNVGGSGNYGIPADNPFVGADGTCDLIWAIGMRNPWRSSFDSATGDFYLGDVGQGAWEEVDYQPASSTGGENYGWRCYEGNHPFNTSGCGPMGTYDFPILEFESSTNCAVIGGYVYRGTQYPAMVAHYFVTDYCTGNFWDLDVNNGFEATMHTNLTQFGFTSFGEGVDGELYVAKQNGNIYHLQASTVPVAVDDAYQTMEDIPLSVDAPSGVLANDIDKDLDPLTAVLDTSPSNGDLSLNADGAFIYTPTTGFAGVDNFTYHANDGSDDSNVATVIITVTVVNFPPIAQNDTYTVSIGTVLNIAAPGPLDNDTDADGDDLSIASYGNPSLGLLSMDGDGRFTYTPTVAITSTDTFTYVASDGLENSNIATVTLQIIDGNAPPTAISDHYTTPWNSLLNVPAPGILANDSDPNADPLTTNLVSSTTNGTLDLQADGAFVYTPTLNFSGVDTFTYQAYDGQALSGIVSVNITVTADYPLHLPFIMVSE